MKIEGSTVEFNLDNGLDHFFIRTLLEELKDRRDISFKDIKPLRIALAKKDDIVRCSTRPIGCDSGLSCFVCGKHQPLLSNTCLMVTSQEEADIVKEMIPGSRIDYYHGDREVPQVKVGVCIEHKIELKALCQMTLAGGQVSHLIVRNARKIRERI